LSGAECNSTYYARFDVLRIGHPKRHYSYPRLQTRRFRSCRLQVSAVTHSEWHETQIVKTGGWAKKSGTKNKHCQDKRNTNNLITANSNNLYLNNNLIERVNQFTYLGSIIDGSVVTETDVATRIQEARMALGALHKIWNSRAHSAGTKNETSSV
jgi:hypothetical protein